MRLVVKIGTSSVTDDRGAIRQDAIANLCDQVAQLRSAGHDVLVVTSGSVAGGVAALGMTERPSDTLTLQALAAVGQSQPTTRNSHATVSSARRCCSCRTTSSTAPSTCMPVRP